jgi:hypothetical protein
MAVNGGPNDGLAPIGHPSLAAGMTFMPLDKGRHDTYIASSICVCATPVISTPERAPESSGLL